MSRLPPRATTPILLVVVADPATRALLQRDLERKYAERYRVLGAAAPAEALDTLRQLSARGEPPALLVVGQHLSGMSGEELLRQAVELVPDAKRVLLTSYADVDAVVRALKALRIDHYLVQPWQPPEEHLYPVLDDLLTDWEVCVRPPSQTVQVIGHRFSPESHQTRDFLARNCVPFEWLDVERDEEARRLLAASGAGPARLPVVRFADGTQLVQPDNAELAERIGLRPHPEATFYDLVIVGAGPAGLAAAVYGASEGLRTVLVERHAPGGQAGSSSRIENYLGFPAGLTGTDLTRRAVAQARKFEAEIVAPQEVTGLRVDGSTRIAALGDGSELRSHVVLLATGVAWRRLDVPGIDRLTGAGVYYGGTLAEAFFCRGEDIYVVGGANSAGQAALHFARYARTVTMLVRGELLSASMSQYLIDQIEQTKNILLRFRTTVVEVHGEQRLEAITVLDASTGAREMLRTNALFIFIGAVPPTRFLAGLLALDAHGFVETGPDLARQTGDGHRSRDWPLERDPFWLESSVPGIFVAGDVRHGSVKRVAAGVGEGAMAVQFIHQYLAATGSRAGS